MVFLSRSQRPFRLRLVAGALVACATALLSGCGSMIADNMPAAAGGLAADAPARPATPAAYPAVHNMPPERSSTPLSYDQQKQLEDDLVAARNRYGASPDAPPATPTATNPAPPTAANSATGTAANPKAGGARNP